MKRLALSLAGLVALGAALVGGWYWQSPIFALKNLQDAATDGDLAEIERAVDIPAVRASIKTEAVAALDREAGAGTLFARGGRLLLDRAIDNAVTPQTIAAAVAQRPASPLLRGVVGSLSAVAAFGLAQNDFELERGWNTFRLRHAAQPDFPELVFAREGIGWRLVAVDLPGGEDAR